MELVYRYSDMQDFKKFYERFCVDTKLEEDIDLCSYENLCYNADLLNEYLFGCQDMDIHFKFIGFDIEEINEAKTHNNWEWSLIFKVLNRFVKKYPNNTIEFIEE